MISVHQITQEFISLGMNSNSLRIIEKILVVPDSDWCMNLRRNAHFLSNEISQEDLIILIKGIVFSQQINGSLGSPSPVHWLVDEYLALYPENEESLCGWIIDNRVNPYDPWGVGTDFDSRTRAEYHRRRTEWHENRSRELQAREERVRLERTKMRRVQDDHVKLRNAVRRGDVLAVEALLAGGIDWKTTIAKFGSLLDLADQNDKPKMVKYLRSQKLL